jgi:Na+/H+ antiporter NhaA
MLAGLLLFCIDLLISMAFLPGDLEETNPIVFNITASVGVLVSPALFITGVAVYVYGRNKMQVKGSMKPG